MALAETSKGPEAPHDSKCTADGPGQGPQGPMTVGAQPFPLPSGLSRRSDNWSATGNQLRNTFPRSWLVRAGNDLLMMDSLSSARTSQDRRRLGLGSPGSQSVMPPPGQARRWAPGNEGDVQYNEERSSRRDA